MTDSGSFGDGMMQDSIAMGLCLQNLGRGPDSLNGSPLSSLQPRLEIVEQPKARGFRFRYDCEGQSHGGLPGENSEKNRRQKTFPTVRLLGYRGRARIVVSLVSETDPPVPHAHSIVGKNTEDGKCTVEIGPETDMYAQFTNLGILHVTKKKVPEVLTKRLYQQLQLKEGSIDHMDDDPANLTEDERAAIRQQASQIAKTMNLSVVRLCFQAFLPDETGRYTIPVEPVFSQKVFDCKAPCAGTLKISRLDRTNGSVKGGEEIFLLCDKVQKNDIEVIFFEDRADGGIQQAQPWTAKGRFGPNDVHHQYAIVFQTPPYYNMAIEKPVTVLIALRRPSDQEQSEPKRFVYLPQEFDEERIGAKRKKKMQHFNNFFGDGAGGAGIGGGTGGPFFTRGLSDFQAYNQAGGFYGGTGGTNGGNYSGGGNDGGGGGVISSVQGVILPSIQSMDYEQPSSLSSNSSSLHLPDFPAYLPEQPSFPSGLSNSFSSQPSQYPSLGSYQPPTYQQPYPSVPRGAASEQMPKPPPSSSLSSSSLMSPSVSFRRPSPATGSQLNTGSLKEQENSESGIGPECQEDLMYHSNQGSSDVELQNSMQALHDKQEAAFQVCERMFNALLAWASTKDVRYLLAAQRSLTAVQNQEGDTALHLAIIHNHQDVVLQLLDVLPQLPPTETPVVDCLNHSHQSPLHLAVLTRQHKVIQYLLKANANPLVCDRHGDTPLHLACRIGFASGISSFLNRSNHINTEGCRYPELSLHNNEGQTPLHVAVMGGHLDCVRLLINARVDPNLRDCKSGKTALHCAVEKGNLAMTGFLITEAEADPNVFDFAGNTPLHCAAGQRMRDIVSLLLAAGANVKSVNNEGETPLTHAHYGDHAEIVQLLKAAFDQGGLESEDQLSTQLNSVSIKTEGDLEKLDFRARISLCVLLDSAKEGSDWRELSKRLNMGGYITTLQSMSSPTKELLVMYEASDGHIADLKQALIEMNRLDAVQLIERFSSESNLEPPHSQSSAVLASVRSVPVYGSDSILPHVLFDSSLHSHVVSESGHHYVTQLLSGDQDPYPSLATTHS